MIIIPLSLGLIFVLLYLAFRSLLDAFVVLSNVLALSLGGIWALLLTGTQLQHLGRGGLHLASSAWRSWTACCWCRTSTHMRAQGHAAARGDHARGRASGCGR